MRLRLALLAVICCLVSTLLFALPLAAYARQAYQQQDDRLAAIRAHVLASLVAGSSSSEDADLLQYLKQENAQGASAAVFFATGERVGAPLPRSRAVEDILDAHPKATAAPPHTGDTYYFPAVTAHRVRAAVAVTVDTHRQEEQMRRTWAAIGAAVMILPACAGLLADRLGRRQVTAVDRLLRAASRMAKGDLSARIDPAGPPELRRLGVALNALAGRIEARVETEREAAADLSHRLRTPVTALMLQAEALRHPEESRRLLASTERLQREVSHIIERARQGACERQVVADLAAVTRERVAFWLPLAEDQGRACTLTVTGRGHRVYAAQEDVAAAIDALLGNVFTHTPEGTAMAVEVTGHRYGAATLVVRDDGPGFASPRAIERGRSTSGSSGLGLDIVRRLACSTGGGMVIGAGPGGGGSVTVTLGGPPPVAHTVPPRAAAR
ncbi:two-component sensor histidine kinase [Streptomyces spinoverrucosus]|uniref:histidine kinase n=1 Tax=Streptomyces spinoverrucosus TaxID=284043 RepID=A0A4Y3VX04_9ACTN|nr:HAMP domain-containing sensor histidine kinase [Streptomyces spinoverrucosus]GEC09556.1 two-component sensor histidine kinase [Streptomyces spinoverrucosus]GHB95925.1 two-component sensor histidine kinase [Streptomyces spinoverrucosus]